MQPASKILKLLHNHKDVDLQQTGVYTITSCKNGKIYVGSAAITESSIKDSIGFHARWAQHVSHLLNNKHKNSKLQRHVNKYGIQDLRFEILDTYPTNLVIGMESYWINALDAVNTGFNIRYPQSLIIGKNHYNYIDLDQNEVLKLYLTDNLTISEVARRLHVSETPVYRTLIRCNIPIRGNTIERNYAGMYAEYLTSDLTINDVGKKYGISSASIHKGFKRHGFLIKADIVRRDIEHIYNRFISGESVEKVIAPQYGVCKSTVYNIIRQHEKIKNNICSTG